MATSNEDQEPVVPVPGATLSVHEVRYEDLLWTFRDGAPSHRPTLYGAPSTFDPFPGYPHDRAAVDDAVAQVVDALPPIWHVDLYIADREEVSRSNGHSNVHEGGHYEGNTWVKDPPRGQIVLSGKRIPPHPVMSRYLVGHEYGHNVEWMIAHRKGARHVHDASAVITPYAELRELPTPIHRGEGGRWHNAAPEIFACDFRILVAGIDPGFWPHKGIPHPHDVPAIRDWWAEIVDTWPRPQPDQQQEV
jgi:hypothetical protein